MRQYACSTRPLPPILDPRALFELMFSDGADLSPEAGARQNKYRRSILDFVTEDTRTLQGSLGPTDKRKLDEYLSSVRSIEQQLEKAEKQNAEIDPGMEKPYGMMDRMGARMEHFGDSTGHLNGLDLA